VSSFANPRPLLVVLDVKVMPSQQAHPNLLAGILKNGRRDRQINTRKLWDNLVLTHGVRLKNCASAGIVEQAEAEAKQQRLNIWADSQFTAPWDWRSHSSPDC
jgi:hypothetical protein